MAGHWRAAQGGGEPRQAVRSGAGLCVLSRPTRWTPDGLAVEIDASEARRRRTEALGSPRRSKCWARAAIRMAAAGARCCDGAMTTGARTCGMSPTPTCTASRRRFAPALRIDGLRIDRARQRDFVGYLSVVRSKRRVTIVSRTGWHDIGGRSVFVLPGETIGPRGGGARHSRRGGARGL